MPSDENALTADARGQASPPPPDTIGPADGKAKAPEPKARMSGGRTIPSGLLPGERFAGAFDYLQPGAGLRGWALEPDRPGQPVALEAVCQDVVLAASHCVLDRPDIDVPAGRVTHAGFIIGWSKFNLDVLREIVRAAPQAAVEVRIAATGDILPTVREPVVAAELLQLIEAVPLGDQRPEFQEVNAYDEIRASGNFDADWYLAQYGAEFPATTPPLLDYLRRGEAAGAWPNLFFDPVAYAADAQLAESAGALLHYLRSGGAGYTLPGPLFNTRRHAGEHGVGQGAAALGHYLSNRHRLAPVPWFDRAHYAEISGEPPESDLFLHFVRQGFARGLTPGPRKAGAVLTKSAAQYVRGLAERFGWDGEAPRPITPVAQAAPIEEPAAAPPPPPPAPKARPRYAEIEAKLRGMPAAEAARLVQSAEMAMTGEPGGRAMAALTVAVARALAGDGLGAVRAGIAYLEASAAEPDRGETLQRLALLNHRVYERGGHEEALTLYRLLHVAGLQDFQTVQRLLDGTVGQGQTAAAAPLAAELTSRYAAEMNAWGWMALARYHKAAGEASRALDILRAIPPYPQTEAVAEAAVLHRLIEDASPEEAAKRLAFHEGELPPELHGPRFRIAVREADARTLQEYTKPPLSEHLPDWQLAEALFRLVADGRLTGKIADTLLRALDAVAQARGLDNAELIRARSHYLLQHRRWDELGALFESIEGMPVATSRALLLKKFEYYCYAEDPEGAKAIYDAHFRDVPLTKWEGLAVMWMLSEQKRWEEAGRLLIAHVAKGHDFGEATHAAMRIIRKVALHGAVLEAAAQLNPAPDPALEAFLSLVQEDLFILESARGPTGNRHAEQRRRRHRSRWLVECADSYAQAQTDHCLFLCTNQHYFLSLLTFLCSFMGQSPQVNARIFVFLDKDVPRHWYGAVATVATRFNRIVDIIPEDEFLPEHVEHRVEFGFFAAGGTLSRAAYFRTYAARYLLKRHKFRRAVYVDTDIICRGDLTELFEFDLKDKLIAAATEDLTLNVASAAARNNLDPLTYFNSGVLVMRFDDEALGRQMDQAIRISETEPERLILQDECALNIAFEGMTQPLPPRYNFFLRASRLHNGHIEDGLLLHFLEKPKPWDIAFNRGYREEWRVWALLLGTILPQRLYVDIFAAANRE